MVEITLLVTGVISAVLAVIGAADLKNSGFDFDPLISAVTAAAITDPDKVLARDAKEKDEVANAGIRSAIMSQKKPDEDWKIPNSEITNSNKKNVTNIGDPGAGPVDTNSNKGIANNSKQKILTQQPTIPVNSNPNTLRNLPTITENSNGSSTYKLKINKEINNLVYTENVEYIEEAEGIVMRYSYEDDILKRLGLFNGATSGGSYELQEREQDPNLINFVYRNGRDNELIWEKEYNHRVCEIIQFETDPVLTFIPTSTMLDNELTFKDVNVEFKNTLFNVGTEAKNMNTDEKKIVYMDFANATEFGGDILKQGWVQEEQLLWVTNVMCNENINNFKNILKSRTENEKFDNTPALLNCTVYGKMEYSDFEKRKNMQKCDHFPSIQIITPVEVNILVAAAPDLSSYNNIHNLIKEKQLEIKHLFLRWFKTAVTGFEYCKNNDMENIVTGLWGTGVFEIPIYVSILIQYFAAIVTGVKRIQFHYDGKDQTISHQVEEIKDFFDYYNHDQIKDLKTVEKIVDFIMEYQTPEKSTSFNTTISTVNSKITRATTKNNTTEMTFKIVSKANNTNQINLVNNTAETKRYIQMPSMMSNNNAFYLFDQAAKKSESREEFTKTVINMLIHGDINKILKESNTGQSGGSEGDVELEDEVTDKENCLRKGRDAYIGMRAKYAKTGEIDEFIELYKKRIYFYDCILENDRISMIKLYKTDYEKKRSGNDFTTIKNHYKENINNIISDKEILNDIEVLYWRVNDFDSLDEENGFEENNEIIDGIIIQKKPDKIASEDEISEEENNENIRSQKEAERQKEEKIIEEERRKQEEKMLEEERRKQEEIGKETERQKQEEIEKEMERQKKENILEEERQNILQLEENKLFNYLNKKGDKPPFREDYLIFPSKGMGLSSASIPFKEFEDAIQLKNDSTDDILYRKKNGETSKFEYYKFGDNQFEINNKDNLFFIDINNVLKLELNDNLKSFSKIEWHGINIWLNKLYEKELKDKSNDELGEQSFNTYFETKLKEKEIHPIHAFLRGTLRNGMNIPVDFGYFYIYDTDSGKILELTKDNLELNKKNRFVIQCGYFDINQDNILNHLKIDAPHITLQTHPSSDKDFLGDVEIVYNITINDYLRPQKYIKLDRENVEEKYNNIIANINHIEYELDKTKLFTMKKCAKSINLDLTPGESITVLIFHENDDFIQYIAHYNNNFDKDEPWKKKLNNLIEYKSVVSGGAPLSHMISKVKYTNNPFKEVKYNNFEKKLVSGGIPYIYTGVTYIYLIQIARTLSYTIYYNYAETCKNNGEDIIKIKDCNIRHILKTCVVDFAISILALWILVELRLINTDTLETALTVIVLTWLALSLLRLASLAQDKRPSLFLKTIVTMVVLLIPLIIIR
jgi:hypothetical protein